MGVRTLTNQAGGSLTNNATLAVGALGSFTNAGLLTNAIGGTLTGPFDNFTNQGGGSFTNNGTISANLGSLTNNTGATFTNNGDAGTGTFNSANFGFGTLINAGIVSNNSTIGVRTLTNQAGGSLTNNGTLAVGVLGSFTNAGTLTNAVSGTLTGPFDNFTNQAGGTFVNSGKVSANFGSITNNAGATFVNRGEANLFTFTNSGTFVEGIGGTGAGDFGKLLAGNITLGGELDVVLLNGFTPGSGDTFDFISFSGTRTGAFASEVFPVLPPGLSWTLTYEDSLGQVELEVTGSIISNVPEPSTLLLLTGEVTGLLLWRRRRGARRA